MTVVTALAGHRDAGAGHDDVSAIRCHLHPVSPPTGRFGPERVRQRQAALRRHRPIHPRPSNSWPAGGATPQMTRAPGDRRRVVKADPIGLVNKSQLCARLGRASGVGVGGAWPRLPGDRQGCRRRNKGVGFEGVSRFGKAARSLMVQPPAVCGLIGSSGGAKPHRRNFGEAVESLTGSGEYQWMAGNFLKYGRRIHVRSRNAGDIPVDAHELSRPALPRPTFVLMACPKGATPKWLDHQGVVIWPQWPRNLCSAARGGEGLGVSDDYATEKMPPVNVGLLDGQLAWRQHDGGHTDGRTGSISYSVGRLDSSSGLTGAGVLARGGGRNQPAVDGRHAIRYAGASAAAREADAGQDRHLFRRRLDCAAVGSDRLPRVAGELEAELLRVERGGFRLGRGPHRTFCGG